MNVSLTPRLERLVKKHVASGRYGSASEVIRESLRLLESRDRATQAQLAQLKADVAEGIKDLDEGRYVEIRNEADLRSMFDGIRERGRRHLAQLKRTRA